MPEVYTDDFLEAARLRAARCRLIALGLADTGTPDTCARKKRHYSEAFACWESVRISVTGGYDVRPYQCWHCGWWHCGRVYGPGGTYLRCPN